MSSPSLYQIEGLSFAYAGIAAVDDISLDLPPGRFYGIVGPNGSGKTTLLDLLTGLKHPDSGSINFRERPLQSFKRRDLSRQLALVPQEFDTGFGFTVEEIVLMGRHPHIDRFAAPSEKDWKAVDQAMVAIGISDLRHRYTDTLSGGQKQRTVVARALAQETPVLLFDEATSSLDVKYTMQIFNIVRQLVRKESRTVIAVIHNLNLAAAYCDHIIFMKEGRLQQQGPTAETMTAATIAEVFDVQAQVAIDPYSRVHQVSFRYWECEEK
jgi:iron complex transport system ATP-binding protein